MTDQTANTAGKRRARAAAAAKSKAKAAAADVRDRAGDAGDVLREVVSDRPLTTAGVSAATAFIAGVALGMVIAKAFDEPERRWKRLRVGKTHLPTWRDY